MSPFRVLSYALVLSAAMAVAPTSAFAGNPMGGGAARASSSSASSSLRSTSTPAVRSTSAVTPPTFKPGSWQSVVYTKGVRWTVPPAKPKTLVGKAKAFKGNVKTAVKGAMATLALGY